MGKREVRWNRMVELVHQRGFIPIREMAQTLEVSEMTVRRDLAAVEEGGLVKNVNGVLVSSVNRGLACLEKKYDLEEETQVENEAKVLIGRRAAAMIQPMADERVTECLAGVAGAARMLLKMTAAAAGMFLLIIGVVCAFTSV